MRSATITPTARKSGKRVSSESCEVSSCHGESSQGKWSNCSKFRTLEGLIAIVEGLVIASIVSESCEVSSS